MAVCYACGRLRQAVFGQLKANFAAIRCKKFVGNMNLSTTNVRWRKDPSPTQKEVQVLSRQYRDPVQIVSRLIEPVLEVESGWGCELKVARLGVDWWRVSLHFTWPLQFTVTARHYNVQTAEMNAYLLACQLFTNIGLLTPDGETVPFMEELIRAHTSFASRQCGVLMGVQSQYVSTPTQRWTSSISLSWPIKTTTQSVGRTQNDATRNAAVHLFIKLKAEGCLDSANRILLANIVSLPRLDPSHTFTPHYLIYADASNFGYGALLYSTDLEDKSVPLVPWISEHWPDELLPYFHLPSLNSTVFEFCGILSSVYTWKKKFVGKHVRLYTDNLCCATTINGGVLANPKRKKKNQVLLKMFKVLRETCIKYNIILCAEWLDRDRNKPADALAKLDEPLFRTLVPNAKPISKKAKKLNFMFPLIESLEAYTKDSKKGTKSW